jgi:flagellar motility protein MotE (MotC chaperone)
MPRHAWLFMLLLLAGAAPACLYASGGGGHEPAAKESGDVSLTLPVEAPQTRQGRVFTDTEVQLLLELDQQRIELERRTQAVELREKLVDLMEQRLNGRVNELQGLKAELEKLMVRVSGKDDKELQQLAAIYAAMKPTAAAVVLNRVDNAIVLDILNRMPPKKSGKLMEALEPVKARYLSAMMASRTPPPMVSETLP